MTRPRLTALFLYAIQIQVRIRLAVSLTTSNASLVDGRTYDYVVVGGGLTGLTVASRVSEVPGVTVLVVEAGRDDRADPRVYDIYSYGQAFNSDLNWNWPADQGKSIPGGKTLGGSTSINGGAYTRGIAAQYDAWSALLSDSDKNLGWNWDNLFGYMKKSESFTPPDAGQVKKGANYVSDYHGSSGPVHVKFPNLMYGGSQQPFFVQTIAQTHNVSLCADLNGGSPNCVAYTPLTLDPSRGDRRSSAAEAYLTPVESRQGWTVLVQQQVTKVLFQSGTSPAVATGVQFRKPGGKTYTAHARKEVILAAGAIGTPALLQLSGVGNAAKIRALGLKSVVDLPTVGKNLQEQTMSSVGAKGNGFSKGGKGPSDVIAFPNLYQVFGSQGTNVSLQIQSKVSKWAQSQAANGGSAAALGKIFQIQADLITKNMGKSPVVELFYNTGYPSEIGLMMWTLLPFSRGRVEITSKDPFAKPKITVNYFSVDFDLQCQVAGARMARKIINSPPLNTLSLGEEIPGKAVPDNGSGGSDADWSKWIKSTFNSVAHPVGTCSMMSRELGGCVDGRLRVYGVKNLRVVDASILPLQISGHMMGTLYAVAEKAADLIKEDMGK
ncbi:Glucose oxidase [Ceratobasidium theobromae]|uniref:Glucose oxidase n=1 Tax=Ceratobasidium theobromae TaxID=1582974 RepID=A0A5N5QB44_9AGAM|nr:Glucose oxidase [Ceratobasidium theobromae]